MVQLLRVLTVVPANAYDLRRFCGSQQSNRAQQYLRFVSLLEIGEGVRGFRECPSDGRFASHALDQSITGYTLVLKSAIRHREDSSLRIYLSGTVSLASEDRGLSFLRRSTAETE